MRWVGGSAALAAACDRVGATCAAAALQELANEVGSLVPQEGSAQGGTSAQHGEGGSKEGEKGEDGELNDGGAGEGGDGNRDGEPSAPVADVAATGGGPSKRSVFWLPPKGEAGAPTPEPLPAGRSHLSSLFCRRCFTYDCLLHGQAQPRPRWHYAYARGASEPTPAPTAAAGRGRPSGDPTRAQSIAPRCTCKLLAPGRREHVWDDTSDKSGPGDRGGSSRDADRGVPSAPERSAATLDELAGGQKRGRSGQPVTSLHLRLKQGASTYERYGTMCDCEGPCDTSNPNCVCISKANFCEVFCACGPKCKNRYSGCRCNGNCGTKLCPCFTMGHECDADLCSCPVSRYADSACAKCMPTHTRPIRRGKPRGGAAGGGASVSGGVEGAGASSIAPKEGADEAHTSVETTECRVVISEADFVAVGNGNGLQGPRAEPCAEDRVVGNGSTGDDGTANGGVGDGGTGDGVTGSELAAASSTAGAVAMAVDAGQGGVDAASANPWCGEPQERRCLNTSIQQRHQVRALPQSTASCHPHTRHTQRRQNAARDTRHAHAA